MSPRRTLDDIEAEVQEMRSLVAGYRKEAEDYGAEIAQMADELERMAAEDWKEPDDVEAPYREPLPLDWALQEALAKDAAKGRLAEEPREPDSAGYTIYVEDSD